VKFPIRELSHRIRLDKQYLTRMRPKCPVCGLTESLKVDYDPVVNVNIYCNYRIVCTNCGYTQKDWHDTLAEAVELFI